MNAIQTRRHPRRAARACLALLLFYCGLAAGAETGSGDRTELERRLAAAREQLDQAAREVADLSRQLYGDPTRDVLQFVHGGPRGAMLGINLASGPGRDEGVEVAGVSPGGPAERAGLRAGDVITAVDGQALRRSGERSAARQLVEFMHGVEPGSPVRVDYLRDGGKASTTVETAPAEPPIARLLRERLPAGGLAGLPIPGLEALLGPEPVFSALELVPLTPRLGRYFGTEKGLLVVRVGSSPGLPLEEGDVLQSIDGREPENPGHAFRILRSYQPGEKVKLGVMRDRKRLELEVILPQSDRPAGAGHGLGPAPPPPPPRPSRPTDAGPA